MRVTLRRLFAAAVLATMPTLAQAAAPIPSTPAKGEKTPLAAIRKALDEVGDMTYQARSLNDIIADLKNKAKVPVILDSTIFQFGIDPSQPVVNVNLKKVKLREGLQAALAPFNLKFGLTADGLFISTEEGVITRQLRQRVTLDCEGTAFATIVKQLAADTGVNLVVDPRLGEKAKKPVTLALEDVPLETAVRLLAEVSDFRAVRSSNVLFVTTAEKAKDFHDDGPTMPSPASPFFRGGINPPPGGFGGVAGFGVVFPGAADGPPAVAVEAPANVAPPPAAPPVQANPPAPPPEKKG